MLSSLKCRGKMLDHKSADDEEEYPGQELNPERLVRTEA